MSRHIPVAAKREVLRQYRWRRSYETPFAAMDAVMNKYASGYADRMPSDARGTAQHQLDCYRAARYYAYSRICGRGWYDKMHPGLSTAEIEARKIRKHAAEWRALADQVEAKLSA